MDEAGTRASGRGGGGGGFARLAWVVRWMRGLLLVERGGWIAVGLFAALGALILTDYALHLPVWARVIWLAVGTFGVGVLLWVRLRPVVRFRPDVEQLALLVEGTAGGRAGGLSGVLASGVGLERVGGSEGVVRRAAEGLGRLGIGGVVNPRGAVVAVAGVVVCAALGVAALAAAPTLTLIGVQRALLPWTTAQWPKRQDVRDVTGVRVHPLGQALPLRAAMVRGPEPGEADVTVWYRVVGARGSTPWRQVGAAYQGRSVAVPMRDELDTMRSPSGPLFERLLEPGSLVVDASEPGGGGVLQYRFDSGQDGTETAEIKLVPPPAIVNAQGRVEPPAYAKGLAARKVEMGPGTDERAGVGGVLPGSRVVLALKFNKVVGDPAGAIAERLGGDVAGVLGAGGSVRGGGDAWELQWVHRGTVRVLPRPVDEGGLTVIGEPAYRFELREDKPAEGVVAEPGQDVEVLASATVRVAGQGRDDVGLEWAALRVQVARRVGGSGGEVEPVGQWKELARAEGGGLSAGVSAELSLGELGVQGGDEVRVVVVAQDGFELDGARHGEGRSPVRKIRVITAEQMLEQLWGELGGVRRSAQRLGEQQLELAERTGKGADAAEAARRQPEISEQVVRAQESMARVERRQRDNGLGDEELAEVLRQGRGLAQRAREESDAAGQGAARAQRAQEAGEKAQADAARAEVARAQERATSALDELAGVLDRGQDTWAARRSLQKLIREQQGLRAQAEKLAEQTLGKTPEELSAELRQQIGELAGQQEQLAKRADEAFTKLQERARGVAKSDPLAAESLEQAAKQGRASGAGEQMQQAARSLRRNQQQAGQQSQKQAEKALQGVLDQLRDQAKTRDAVLRREMASLAEAIGALVARQQEQIGALEGAMVVGGAAVAALDGAQIRLNSSTVAAAQQARQAGREGRQVAWLLDEAGKEQVAAVSALRRKPDPDGEGAMAAQRAALLKLQEAKGEAERQQEQAEGREQRRQREQLRRAYQGHLLEQRQVRAEGAGLIGVELDRRGRARGRALADRQEALAGALAKLLEQTAGLREATMFALAHERLDAAMRLAGGELALERVPVSAGRHLATAEGVLRQLVDALEEPQQENAFRENEQGQGGGGGGGQQGGKQPLLPPIAELRLLKGMQQEALELTRQAEGGVDGATGAEAAKLQEMLAGKADELLKAMEKNEGGRGQ